MANRPKSVLLVLLALVLGIGLVTASGAFESVAAERTVTVSTSGDGSALLRLQVVNPSYATMTNGLLEISIGGLDSGLNRRAETDLQVVFNITNNGYNDLGTLYIADEDSEAPAGYDLTGSDRVSYRTAADVNIEGPSNATTLAVGETVGVKLVINTSDVDTTGDLGVGDIVIVAER